MQSVESVKKPVVLARSPDKSAKKHGAAALGAEAAEHQHKPGKQAQLKAVEVAAKASVTAVAPAAAGASVEGSGLLTRADLNETMKALVHLAHENGYLSYDDINDLLPEGLSPEELDEVLTKLRA